MAQSAPRPTPAYVARVERAVAAHLERTGQPLRVSDLSAAYATIAPDAPGRSFRTWGAILSATRLPSNTITLQAFEAALRLPPGELARFAPYLDGPAERGGPGAANELWTLVEQAERVGELGEKGKVITLELGMLRTRCALGYSKLTLRTRQTWHKWYTERRQPELTVILALADLCRIDPISAMIAAGVTDIGRALHFEDLDGTTPFTEYELVNPNHAERAALIITTLKAHAASGPYRVTSSHLRTNEGFRQNNVDPGTGERAPSSSTHLTAELDRLRTEIAEVRREQTNFAAGCLAQFGRVRLERDRLVLAVQGLRAMLTALGADPDTAPSALTAAEQRILVTGVDRWKLLDAVVAGRIPPDDPRLEPADIRAVFLDAWGDPEIEDSDAYWARFDAPDATVISPAEWHKLTVPERAAAWRSSADTAAADEVVDPW